MPKRTLYAINQCALYKTGSKAKLAFRLGISLTRLLALASNESNYRVFLLREEICPFTKKVKKERLVQEPKAELRKVHERIQKLLKSVAPPDYAHAAIKGRSYSSNAIAHKDANCLATFDICKFYPSTSKSHIYNFFNDQLQCAPDVAALLTALTCYKGQLPTDRAGLPTGSPLSPLLSLYANKPLFDKLNDLASSNGLKFTCYVDDLTFSGDALPLGLTHLVTKALEQQGHKLSVKKTRIFRRSQEKHVTGVVIFKNMIHVPHSRFWKARGITAAIKAEKNTDEKLQLAQKLAGLLGEASFLDSRYSGWAKSSYDYLKLIKEKAGNHTANNAP